MSETKRRTRQFVRDTLKTKQKLRHAWWLSLDDREWLSFCDQSQGSDLTTKGTKFTKKCDSIRQIGPLEFLLFEFMNAYVPFVPFVVKKSSLDPVDRYSKLRDDPTASEVAALPALKLNGPWVPE